MNHGEHRMHGKGKGLGKMDQVFGERMDPLRPLSDSVYSVQSVVKISGSMNHGVHRMHGVGKGLGKMYQVFGDRMDPLIGEPNKELTA
jgi:hypothetical protein